MKRTKIFRPTPNEVQDAMKRIVGNKSSSSIKEFEEDDKNIEEKTAVITSIQKDKIHGDGWTVKTSDGQIYKCSCASNLYEIPKSKEKGGVLYPENKAIKCKIKINPLLRTATITEIIGSKKKKEKLNISKWTHKNQDTTVIASPKSAISISDGGITFNYNDETKLTINNKGVKIQGGEVTTTADNFEINNESIEDLTNNKEEVEEINTDNNSAIKTITNNNISEIKIIEVLDIDLNERVIGNILNQKQTPISNQKRPLLSEENIDELNIYENGIITVKGRIQKGKRHINHTEKWMPQKEKNIIKATTVGFCDYCYTNELSHQTFIDYCPVCKQWNILSQNGDIIICGNCYAKFCSTCGHYKENDVTKNLKKYENFNIDIMVGNCEYCDGILPTEITKQYVNYCPECKTWGILDSDVNQLYCKECNTYFCGNCGTQQSGYKVENFYEKKILYDNYIKKMKKLLYIKES